MIRRLSYMFAAFLLVGMSALYVVQTGGDLPGISTASAQSSAENSEAAPESTEAIPEFAPDMVMGSEDAPVTVIEYASYTCPHCARFHETVLGQLKADYIDTGKVRFVYREVYFDRYGLWAGMLARCGGELRYFGISDLLYKGQSEWIGQGEPGEVLANLRKIGRLAGMDDEQISACMEDKELAQSMVAAFQKNSAADDINSTPSFVINGEKYSNMSYADFRKVLDAKLAE